MKPNQEQVSLQKRKLTKYVERMLWAFMFMAVVMACQPVHQKNNHTKRDHSHTDKIKDKTTGNSKSQLAIFSPTWTVTAELRNMQVPIKVASELHLYKDWVGNPALPKGTIDVGSRYQPNPELLSQIQLDQIIDSSWYAQARSLYGNVPVQGVEFSIKDKVATWQALITPTLAVGKIIKKTKQTQQYINQAEQQVVQLGHTFKLKHPYIKKIAIIQFQDVSTLRLYAKNSIAHITLKKMGVELATLGKQNAWGFASVPLANLTALTKDTCVVIIEPHSSMMQKQLKQSLIWQRLDYGNSRCITTIPALWLYGGINSVVNLATYLTKAKFVGGKPTVSKSVSNAASNAVSNVKVAS